MKIAICYLSVHHGNTRKVVEGVAKEVGADLIDLARTEQADLSSYDLVGFASGAFFGHLHEKLEDFIRQVSLAPTQRVFFLVTCGMTYRDYARAAKKRLAAAGIPVVGSFQCRGFDTYGPFGVIGGIAKKHPNEADIQKATAFVKQLL